MSQKDIYLPIFCFCVGAALLEFFPNPPLNYIGYLFAAAAGYFLIYIIGKIINKIFKKK